MPYVWGSMGVYAVIRVSYIRYRGVYIQKEKVASSATLFFIACIVLFISFSYVTVLLPCVYASFYTLLVMIPYIFASPLLIPF